MIKFTGEHNGRVLIGLGLSEGNIQRLKRGEPIHIHFEELNLPHPYELLVFYGATEEEMARELKPMIRPETKVFEDPKCN